MAVTTETYTNATGDTHELRIFPDGSVIVNDFEAFSTREVAIRFCDVETIYDDDASDTEASGALYGTQA